MTAESSENSNISFRELYRRYAKKVYAYCIHNHFDRDFAQNVFQDAWLNLFDYIKNGNKINSIPAVLITICRRRIIDDIRRENKKPEFVKLDKVENFIENEEEVEIDYTKIIEKAINQLDENIREIFVMNKISGLKITEIAEITGENYDTLKKRIYRATLKVKEITLRMLKEE